MALNVNGTVVARDTGTLTVQTPHGALTLQSAQSASHLASLDVGTLIEVEVTLADGNDGKAALAVSHVVSPPDPARDDAILSAHALEGKDLPWYEDTSVSPADVYGSRFHGAELYGTATEEFDDSSYFTVEHILLVAPDVDNPVDALKAAAREWFHANPDEIGRTMMGEHVAVSDVFDLVPNSVLHAHGVVPAHFPRPDYAELGLEYTDVLLEGDELPEDDG